MSKKSQSKKSKADMHIRFDVLDEKYLTAITAILNLRDPDGKHTKTSLIGEAIKDIIAKYREKYPEIDQYVK